MEQIFRVILSLSISGGLVGLLILLCRPVTRRFFAKRWTYYLWLLVLVRLLVPVHGDINLMGRLSTMMAEADSRQVSVEEVSEYGDVENAEVEKPEGNVSGMESAGTADKTFDVEIIENIGRNETAIGTSVDKQEANRRAHIFQIAGIIWILGVFLTIVYRVCTYKIFVKGINAGCVAVTDRRLLCKSAEIQTRLGIIREVPLYENASINTPMLIGFRKPHIVLPSNLVVEMDGGENDIRLILHHELIHYKRRDIWYKWLFQVALCVHWFNPLLYLFNRIFNVDCELACDEAVMALLSEEGRRIYGNVLLDVAERNLSGEAFVMHRNVPAMTLLEEKKTLKERLYGIAKYQKKGFVIGFCSALVLAVFVALAVACGVAGVHTDSGSMFVMRNSSPGIVGRVLKNIPDIPDVPDIPDIPTPSVGGLMPVNKSGNAYRIYDDDELIAGESEHDTWEARNCYGGETRRVIDKFVLNGSDVLWIMYANKETTLEISSTFDLHDGRFKFVWVKPDRTVNTLNESGEKNTVKITLPQGRNVIKMVGQKAHVENIEIAYSGVDKKDIDGIYYSEDEEYAYRVQAGLEPLDMARLDDISIYLDAKEVSEFYRYAWESGIVLSSDNWENLFIYSDQELTSCYLLEALQDGKIKEFDSQTLVEIASYMRGEDVSECFRYLLEHGKVSESDLEDILIYSDADLSSKYLIEAIKKGELNEFNGKLLAQVSFRISPDDLTDLVLTLGKDELTFHELRDYVIPYLGEEQTMQCIYHYIDLGNVLTDSQLWDLWPRVSEENYLRVIEYNGKQK
ncbi:MAG: M56 family metallopeptidase [Lachnospiraceae bacterium]|nr:M56 family metallopeptidase [Lachnospiraceae bacterium]